MAVSSELDDERREDVIEEALKHCDRLAVLCPHFPADQKDLPSDEVHNFIFFDLLHATSGTKSKSKHRLSGWRRYFFEPQGKLAWHRLREGVLLEASKKMRCAACGSLSTSFAGRGSYQNCCYCEDCWRKWRMM